MSKNMTKRTWVLIGIFVLTAIVGLSILSRPMRNANEKMLSQESPVPSATATKTGTAQQAKVYTQLVNEYKDRRIQFDAMCQAIPNNVTFKNGTKVMFDNRSGEPRYISVGGTKYYFAGYGYKIITLSSGTLPKNLYINCGAAVNVGQILLQK